MSGRVVSERGILESFRFDNDYECASSAHFRCQISLDLAAHLQRTFLRILLS